MKILGVQAKQLAAMIQQGQSACQDGQCPFAQMLKQAADAAASKTAGQTAKTAGADSGANSTNTTEGTGSSNSSAQQVEMKLNEAIGVAFIAPLLAQTIQNVEQTYFLHSPAEQAYAKQMYLDIASRMSTSGKMPLAKNIAKAVLEQLGSAEWKAQDATDTETPETQTQVTA